MRKKLFLLILAGTLLGFSASAKEEVESYRYSTSESRLLDFVPSVAPIPLTVEVKVRPTRIHEVINLNREELAKRIINNDYNKTLENLRSYAVFATSGKYECDLIVGARFNFELTQDGATIELFGYPADFVNWGGKTSAAK